MILWEIVEKNIFPEPLPLCPDPHRNFQDFFFNPPKFHGKTFSKSCIILLKTRRSSKGDARSHHVNMKANSWTRPRIRIFCKQIVSALSWLMKTIKQTAKEKLEFHTEALVALPRPNSPITFNQAARKCWFRFFLIKVHEWEIGENVTNTSFHYVSDKNIPRIGCFVHLG